MTDEEPDVRPPFESVSDLSSGADVLRRRAYGVIDAAEGRFRRVLLRPFPKLISLPGILVLGKWRHHRPGDRCLLYYNQPCRFPNYLAVTYLVSGQSTTLRTIGRVLEALDEIARLKRSDALLCHVANGRISERIMARLGWEPLRLSYWGCHYVRRFYGSYPPPLGKIASPGDPAVV